EPGPARPHCHRWRAPSGSMVQWLSTARERPDSSGRPHRGRSLSVRELHCKEEGESVVNNPLRFVPHLRPMVWGGRRLEEVLGKPLPTQEPYGEAWEISDHGSHHSVVASGHDLGEQGAVTLHQ